MRISSLSFFNASLSGIQDQQSRIAQLSAKIAANKNFLAAKEAPIDAARALQLAERLAVRDQFVANQEKADIALKYETTVLDGMHKALNDLQGIISQTSASNEQTIKDQVAIQIANLYKQVKDMANTRDASGDYIFAGHETSTLPYVHVSTYDDPLVDTPATYAGDEGVRRIEIDVGRFLQSSDSINSVLQAAPYTGGYDLLETLDQLAVDLRAGTVTQTAITDAFSVVTAAVGNLENTRTSIAGRSIELGDARTTGKALILADQNALGEIEELDQAAAIIELQQRQTALQASMQAFSLTSKLSMFDYL